MSDRLDDMTDEEFCDQLFSDLEKAPCLVTKDGMNEIESWWRATMRNRRCALAMITMPFSELRDKVIGDREFAEAVAAAEIGAKEVIEGIDALSEMLKAAQARTMCALACREDMQDIYETADGDMVPV